MRELFVFACVGVLATCTHYSIAIALVEFLTIPVLTANFFAYCGAVGVSYVGHSKLTFKAEMNAKGLMKFIVVSILALLLSQALLAALSYKAWFDYKINMLITVCFIPCVSFILNKFWVYKVQTDE